MNDLRIAALAEVVKEALKADLATCGGNRWPNERFLAIFIAENLPPDWCGHDTSLDSIPHVTIPTHARDKMEAEIIRLRKIEVAARGAEDVLNLSRSAGLLSDEEEAIHDALRAALEADR